MKDQQNIAPAYLYSKKLSGDELKYDFYPKLPGLIYVGGTCNGDYVFWHAEGDPDTWPIIVYAHAYIDPEYFEFGIVEFLIRWLDGSLKSQNMWPAKELTTIRPKPIFQAIADSEKKRE